MKFSFILAVVIIFFSVPVFAQQLEPVVMDAQAQVEVVASETNVEASVQPQEEAVMSMPGLQVGEQAPDFNATTYEGKSFRFSDIYSQKPTVLIFYRGGWCPYCNTHLRAIQSKMDDFNRLGVSVVALSVDKPEKAAATVAEQTLTFVVVSDPGAETLNAYRLVEQVPEELVIKYKNEYGIDLEDSSGQTHHTIAVPAVYILNKNGKVLYAHADRNYQERKSPEEIIAMLEELLFL